METFITNAKAEAHLIREGWEFEGDHYQKDGKEARVIKTGYFEHKIQIKEAAS